MSVSLNTHPHHHHVAQGQKAAPTPSAAADGGSPPAASATASDLTAAAPSVDATGMGSAAANFLSVLSRIRTNSGTDGSSDATAELPGTARPHGHHHGPPPSPGGADGSADPGSSSDAAASPDDAAPTDDSAMELRRLLEALQAYSSGEADGSEAEQAAA